MHYHAKDNDIIILYYIILNTYCNIIYRVTRGSRPEASDDEIIMSDTRYDNGHDVITQAQLGGGGGAVVSKNL